MKSSSPFISALLLIGGVFISLPAQTQLMPVEKVEPGMQGTGVTVFAGNERTEFSAEILGVLQNSMGPLRHLILARLEGGPLEDSGVIQGMSGSPVYIDDQLIGAVSYSLGSFSKDTIAGITPIGEMLREDLTPPTGAVRSIPSLPLPLSTDSLTSLTPNGLRASVPFETNQRDLTALAVSIPSFLGGLQPIPTPLTLSGFTRQSFDYLDPMFRSTGMVRVAGGGFSTLNQPFSDAPLEPGDPIGVGLIQGDLSMAGTGTVTYIDGNRVYAFGHQFYNAGPSTFPMTRAYVHTVLPSQALSSRITSIGETLGTIDHDRSTGISGTLGNLPPLVPVHVELLTPDRNRPESFDFSVVADDLFTPFLSYNAVLNTLLSYSRQLGAATYSLEGQALLDGLPPVTFQESFSGASSSVLAALYVSGPLTALLNNEFEPITVEKVDVSITAHTENRTATLDRVWLDDPRPRLGRPVPLRIAIRNRRGDELLRTVIIDLPASNRDQLQLLVSDGASLARRERQQTGQAARPTNVLQLIDALNSARRNNHLYIQLLRSDTGAVVNGQRLPSLPTSVLGVVSADQRPGTFAPLRTAVLREWSLPFDHVISGSRILSIDIDALE